MTVRSRSKENCVKDENKQISHNPNPDVIKDFDRVKLKEYMHRAYKWARDLEYICGFASDEEKEEDEDPDDEGRSRSHNGKRLEKNKQVLDTKKRLRGLTEIEEKLEEIKGKRLTSVEEVRYKKNLKTRLKKQRKKLEKRAERDAKRKNKKKKKNKSVKGGVKHSLTEGGSPAPALEDKKAKEESSEKFVFNKEGKMVFNKIDFSGVGKEKKAKKRHLEKDPKFLLDEIKKKKSKLDELEQSGESSKAKSLKEKEMWMSALKKAEGVKVKDDPNLLKKTMRKQKEMKNRRQRKWENRVQTIEKKKEERQKKRQENIAAKKQEKKKKKIKRSIKKGRIVI